MTVTDTDRAAELRRRLARRIAAAGHLPDPRWREVFERVPRHVFVPAFWQGPDRRITPADRDWLDLVYADDVLVTQLTGGAATSSSTAPALMLDMLHALDVHDGNRVFEVAAGTGYNLALLAERLGPRNVSGIEVDRSLAGLARERLEECGYPVTVYAGDGRAGHPGGEMCDRLIATCGFASIPAAWLRQVRPGGVIVAPIGWGTVRLVVGEGGGASGRFLPFASYFMTVRAEGARGIPVYPGTPAGTTGRATDVDPGAIGDDSFRHLLSIVLPGLGQSTECDGHQHVTACQLWADDGSWARVEAGTVRQCGPRRLWDTVEEAYAVWVEQGRPGRDRYGITVTPDGQRVWIGDPGGPSWLLPAA
ncbi:methyltransferase domain-containing protein [Kitasatospora sp. NPDC056076]|uniref:methyltransferase domain-containing protein n=1 Tax=Kitasatospora sp. NPDC056076 TaxID=3345703 RepID=UPI0035E22486